MNESTIKEQLQRITEDLKELFEIVHRDCRSKKDNDRYSVGVLVGIGYVQRELEKLVKGIYDESTE